MTPARTTELPPVLIRITRTNPRGITRTIPYLNPGMSAEDAARYENPAAPGTPDGARIRDTETLAKTLALGAVASSVVGVLGFALADFSGAQLSSSVGQQNAPLIFALGCGAGLLIAAAVTVIRAAAWGNRAASAARSCLPAHDLISLSSIDRYVHYDDAEQLVLSLQASREAAGNLYGDGRARVSTALYEALTWLHTYATTAKPTPALRTSAHNAVEAVNIIARHEGANL